MSVWASIETLYEFAYKTAHVGVLRERERWFEKSDISTLAVWWLPAGTVPSVDAGMQRLEHLHQHGPSEYAFTFKERYPRPEWSEGGVESCLTKRKFLSASCWISGGREL